MKHRIVTAAQMKAIEQAGNAHGLPYLQMMENAGLAVYAELKKALPQPSTLLVEIFTDGSGLSAEPFTAVVDALYGTGFHGSLRPSGLAACALMNRQHENGAFVLAVDLPSGINTDTGEVAEGAVCADLTVTFDSCKPLHTAASSAPLCGKIVCADIGIRDEWHPAF